MDSVLSLQMLDTNADAAFCLSWASCNSATSCRSDVSGVIIVEPKPAPGPVVVAV